ncbi:protein kinase PINOID [Amborella trichopoda]|uniref:non-specific serine/threonine protein kinase n=1 Tax=Amborella trichopoda TaxID=13333 RepID=W1NQH8_AMBTC|nr:protein kinase PINOID [Amborella trichopoda]ERM99156.1 hypothetical protein AMTR_s00092p00027310 [Amborella trichopoda]|eukprot:XP_006836303.1 protein kinase PINOID [Amborella trichopoda]
MSDYSPDSDSETNSDMLNSGQSSASDSSSGSLLSRLSFENLTGKSPENQIPAIPLKPHKTHDSAWEAIKAAKIKHGGLNFRDFRLIRRLGSGDIGNVYLSRLRGGDYYYAMKVVDKEALEAKKKLHRAEMERKILAMLDHPFLPTLYAEFEASNFSCVVMEFCSGGDLHTLRHSQKRKRFSLSSARFYAAEVLLALEYLHMLGIIYRDLKPENVLLRSDGHIMLSDFDLSLKSTATNASLEIPVASPANRNSPEKWPDDDVAPSCLCFLRPKLKKPAINREFIAEPVHARSSSFVGTHEYISPEVASGGAHGNAVDWWAYGIFLYELVYGCTPFSGENNSVTLRNIVKRPLTFPPGISLERTLETALRSLITGLLEKDPRKRLGSKRGAAEIKTQPFFRGLNFALIRSATPPEIPGFRRTKTSYQRKPSYFDYF